MGLLFVAYFFRGEPRIEVSFEVDVNGILTVTAVEGENKRTVVINSEKGRLSSEEIQRMVEEAKEREEDDRAVCKPTMLVC